MEKHKQEEKMRYQTAVKQQVTDGHTGKKRAKDYMIIHKNILYILTYNNIHGHHRSRE